MQKPSEMINLINIIGIWDRKFGEKLQISNKEIQPFIWTFNVFLSSGFRLFPSDHLKLSNVVAVY